MKVGRLGGDSARGSLKGTLFLVFAALVASPLVAVAAHGQTKTTRNAPARPASAPAPVTQYKGIWEPVSFNADVKLFDVFFTSPEEGWVAGGTTETRGGIILHTSDGGNHWDVPYGDPQSSDRGVHHLRFLDPAHGWAIQDTGSASRLLHTRDGQSWLLAGTMPEHATDYMFTSETTGVALKAGHILQTLDGGRTWRQVGECQVTAQAQGLARNLGCEWARLQFVTPQVGYAVGFNRQARNLAFVARTSDGGATWSLITSEVTDIPQDAFFLDERTGYLRVGAPNTGQIFKTTDGGGSWTGMAASPGARIQFADPEVGWAILYDKVSFTTDGGNRWNSRQYPFPARMNAFSLPRRDRGYVVGEHGMIYRYRIVPLDYAANGMIPAPLLSGIDSPLDSQTQQLVQQVQRMAQDVGVAPMSFTQDTGATSPPSGDAAFSTGAAGSSPMAAGGMTIGGPFSGTIPGCPGITGVANGMSATGTMTASASSSMATSGTNGGGFTQDTSAAAATSGTSQGFVQDAGNFAGAPAAVSAGVSSGFVQTTNTAAATANAVSATVPQFVSKYRNLNLLMTGFQVATQMPSAASCLNQSFQALKHVKDPQSAMAAVTNIQYQMRGLVQMVRMAFQRR